VKIRNRKGLNGYLANLTILTLIFGGLSFGALEGLSIYQEAARVQVAKQNHFWRALDNQATYSSTSSAGQFVDELKPLLAKVEIPANSSRLNLHTEIQCGYKDYPQLDSETALDTFDTSAGDEHPKRLSDGFMAQIYRFKTGGSASLVRQLPVAPISPLAWWQLILAGASGLAFLISTGISIGRLRRYLRNPYKFNLQQALVI